MKCDECGEEEATLECCECGRPYCEECASDRDGACCIETIRPMENKQLKRNIV